MNLTDMTIASLLTFGGLTVAISVVFELIKRAWKPTADTLDRFGPVIAVGLGIIIAGGAAAYQNVDVVQNIVLGIFAGLAASGLYDAVTSKLGIA